MGCGTSAVVPEGERWALWTRNGRLQPIDGPRRVWAFGGRITELQRHTADQHQYLVIKNKNGSKEHRRGPCALFFDPLEHIMITTENAVSIDGSEVLVVYRQQKDGAVSRVIVKGPTLHVPSEEEWLHQFSWHGKFPDGPIKKGEGIMPNALKFTKLRIIPDHFYYNVSEVRTSDDTMITCKLMLFFELEDVEVMLDQTHDPIADFINALCADVVNFACTLTYEMFMNNTAALSQPQTYPQLTTRAKQIGYKISKIVFRGYLASDRLQSMHDEAIQKRTMLRLQSETQEQEQQLADMKLTKEIQRTTKKHEMEAREQEHKTLLSKMAFEEQMRQQKEKDKQKLEYLMNLQNAGVDLTKYMVALEQHPQKLIQICADGNSQGPAPKLVIHTTKDDK